MSVRVGKMAPDFVATAYVNGEFLPISLSDFRDHWVLLYFYPGDFTFV
jgi:alkyl hydroperoxide reductase subunit AhpC